MTGEPAESAPTEIRLAVIGKGASGKTVMRAAVQKIGLRRRLGEGFEFGPLNRLDTKATIRSISDAEKKAYESIIQRTTKAEDFRYALFRAENEFFTFLYSDAIGQLLSDTDEQGGPNQDAHYEFMKVLSTADVIWACLPLNVSGDGATFDEDDCSTIKSYLRDILKKRVEGSAFALAVTLTKADRAASIQGNHESARPVLDVLMKKARHEFEDLIRYSPKVSNGAVFPVSAFGFGNAQKLEGISDATIVNKEMEPWNVDTLLFWSLDCGLLQPGQPTRLRTKLQQQAVMAAQPAIADAFDKAARLQGSMLDIIKGARE